MILKRDTVTLTVEIFINQTGISQAGRNLPKGL